LQVLRVNTSLMAVELDMTQTARLDLDRS